MDFDLIVIGGGAAGLAAAREAARQRVRVLLVTDGEPGGDCTFTGCVPSKTLIECAARGVPFPEAMALMRRHVAGIAATEDAATLSREGIEVRQGRARFRSGQEVEVNGGRFRASRFVVATGSRPAVPGIPGLRGLDYLTSDDALALEEPPEEVTVLGGGATGCELAQALRRFGARVTIVEAGDRLLPGEDPRASGVIEQVFAGEGITVHTGRRLTRVEAPDAQGQARLVLDDGATLPVERLLVATGRRPVTSGLDPAAAGVRADDTGHMVTDDHLATTRAGIYAAGDVTGRAYLSHAADDMGRVAAGNALARRGRERFDATNVPVVTFTDPEVARVGLDEGGAARHRGRVAYLPMTEVDRAIVAGAASGFVKLLAGPQPVARNLGGGRLLGATVVAARAGEMIHEPALAVATGVFTGRLAQASHAYPTWSVAIRQAAAQFFRTTGGRRATHARRDSGTGC